MSATLTPPELMQRFAALDRGNDVRIRRAQLKRDLHDRTRRIEEVVREPEWWMLTMPVCELLGYAPRIGPVRVNRILRRADVWPLREVGRLTVGQRERIVAEIGTRGL